MEQTLEATQARHRKEQRDLQSRITSKKKSATKKTRRGVNDECAELERQLRERQEREIAALLKNGVATAADGGEGREGEGEEGEESQNNNNNNNDKGGPGAGEEDAIAKQLRNTNLTSPSPPSQSSRAGPTTNTSSTVQQQPQQQPQAGAGAGAGGGGGGKKRNRQKERLARRAAEVEAAAEAAEAEAANMTDHRAIERTHLEKAFAAHGLVEREIRPDGHCLFAAVADQLEEREVSPLSHLPSSATSTTATDDGAGDGNNAPGYKIVRRAATEYMEAHPDDFAPFLDEPLRTYAPKIRDTAEWGGQLELAALASAYGVEIKVVQGDGRIETIEPSGGSGGSGGGKEGGRQRIWLAYYRHGYGLGEHYNSLRKAKVS